MSEDGTDRTLREELAALEHQQWWEWSKTVAREEDISEERIERWRQYWKPYEDLPDDVKDHDRKWADRVMELLWDRLVGAVTCRYCGRELPFKEAKDAHEHLHETDAWERAYRSVDADMDQEATDE